MLARWLRCWRTARWGSSGESLRNTEGGGGFSTVERIDIFMQEKIPTIPNILLINLFWLTLPHFIGSLGKACTKR